MAAGSESLRPGVIVIESFKGICTWSYVCDASLSAVLGCLEVPRRLLCQAEVVSSKPIKIGFGCDGLGLLPLWFFALYQLGFITKICALDSVSAASPFLVNFKMFSNLMQCLLSWRSNA